MTFDVFYPFVNKDGKHCPGIKPVATNLEQLFHICDDVKYKRILLDISEGDKSRKVDLPSVNFVGRTKTTRRADASEPTQFVMIDIDHVENPVETWGKMALERGDKYLYENVLTSHITCSKKGLRIILKAIDGVEDIEECMRQYNEVWHFDEYGDYDTQCKDLSRLSFLVASDYVLFFNQEYDRLITEGCCIKNSYLQGDDKAAPKTLQELKESVDEFTAEEKEEFDNMDWRGTPVRLIIDKFVEVYGKPSSGEIHNYYNEMVKNFRCLTSNNKRCLLYLLPRFGHTSDECWSSIKSICKVNTLSTLPKEFYFFLKDNGFYVSRKDNTSPLKDYMMSEVEDERIKLPYLPPVFRELVGTAPKDFVIPVINSLMPILGTLTSYVGAYYPYDNRIHTTSFFSIIFAPPGTGKGFVERFLDMLFQDLKLRDMVQQAREDLYLRAINKKGANDKSPDRPVTSLRIIPPKNSEAEFLQKQKDNQGYHMFTYAAEMDSWAKGVKAAGGNKDDMIRIAWDNGEYGQQFKSASTFKGVVNLYWNVLITGTLQQVESYFRNVENGLVTRCCFTSIDNQEFAAPPKWKQLSDAKMKVIKQFVNRCDENTYEEACTLTPGDFLGLDADEFDKEINWHFKFKPRKIVDLSWIMPTIDAFHAEQMRLAAKDIDRARDVFRRRVGVRGFRLALLCSCLWANPKKRDLEKCCEFIDWWMHQDIEQMLKLWGAKYNNQAESAPNMTQRSVFSSLGETFTRNDVFAVCMKQSIKTPIRRIIFDWKKLGYIEQIDKETFKKKQV